MSLRLKIILGALLVVAVFLIGRVGLVLNKNIKNASLGTGLVSSSIDAKVFADDDPMTKDSDHDGLPDREEIIYGTDPYKADTDGDDFKDGEEVIEGYDPLNPADNPKDNPHHQDSSKQISLLSPTANLTDRLMNLSFASITGDSGQIDPSSITSKQFTDIMADISASATIFLAVKPIGDDDIKISDDNDPEAIRKYLNTITPIIEEGFMSSTSAITSGAVDGTGADKTNNYYDQIYNSLKIVAVPSSWKEIHKQALTDFLKLKSGFSAISDVESDPVKASFAISQIQDAFLQLSNLIKSASDLAKSQNVQTQDSILNLYQSADSTGTTSNK